MRVRRIQGALAAGLLALAATGLTTSANAAEPPQPPPGVQSSVQSLLDQVHQLANGAVPGADSGIHGIDGTYLVQDLIKKLPSMTQAQQAQVHSFLSQLAPAQKTTGSAPTVKAGSTSPRASATPSCTAGKQNNYQTTHFDIHYYCGNGSKSDATPSFVQNTVAPTLEHVYTTETGGSLSFTPPKLDGGSTPSPAQHKIPGFYSDGSALTVPNPDGNRVDIKLLDLGDSGIYGLCAPDGEGTNSVTAQDSAFCALDNNFSYSKFQTTPTRSLDVTAAHEFFHAIQFGYSTAQPSWFGEGSAVWMEDEVYNDINDYLQYVANSPIRQPRTPFTSSANYHNYGDFSLFKFLQGWLGDNDSTKKIWTAVKGDQHANAIGAISKTIAADGKGVPSAWAYFGQWNTLPSGSYPERASYRPAGFWKKTSLSSSARSRSFSTGLSALANAPVQISLAHNLGSSTHVSFKVSGPSYAAGGRGRLQVRRTNGTMSTYWLNPGSSRTLTLRPSAISSVVVTMTNANAAAGQKTFGLALRAH